MSKQKKFEENLAELETIVQSLENGEIALEDAIAAFQKGMVLSKELQATLDKAEKTLVKVMQEDGTESDFERRSKKNELLLSRLWKTFMETSNLPLVCESLFSIPFMLVASVSVPFSC